MDLADIGFDGWFERKRAESQRPELDVARVTRVDRERYLVRNAEREAQAELAGRLRFSAGSSDELPCVGDWVSVQYYNEETLAIVHELLPRKSFLRRKSAGREIDSQMIAANIDTAFIMQSCDLDFNLRRMERYIVMAVDGRVEPMILLSKSDLAGAEELENMILEIRRVHIDTRIAAFSSKTGAGLDEVRRVLEKGKTYCLLGSSGVGKTTLLNHLLGDERFETNPVREKDGRGRHTTSRRQLTVLDTGALLIDTPGMRELGLIADGASVDDSFSDIRELSRACPFGDCTHTREAGCAVAAAVESGTLSEERYRSYLKLTNESAFHQLSYAEKRRRDRQFGKMIKTAKKQIRKKQP